MPRADNFCNINVQANSVPTATNPLGVKGVGEAGCVGAMPVMMNAVMNALSRWGSETLTCQPVRREFGRQYAMQRKQMAAGLNSLSATEISSGVASGSFTAEAVTQGCLDRIATREDAVMAWEFIDPDLALAQARAVDATADKGLLAGVPVGVKDIIDTRDMPTGMGSPIYDGYRPKTDASSWRGCELLER